MDVFEEQLNVVLDAVPETSFTRSPTPMESLLDSPQAPRSPSRTAPSRSRPTTRDSGMSSMSRMTQGTQQSMMAAMRQGAEKYGGGGSSFMSGDLDGRAFERSDYVSQRIAGIQAKVSYITSSFADSSSRPHFRDLAVCEPSAFRPIWRLYPITKMTRTTENLRRRTVSGLEPQPVGLCRTPSRMASSMKQIQSVVLVEDDLPRFRFTGRITATSETLPLAKTVVEKRLWRNSWVGKRDLPIPEAPHPDETRS